ncbi:MAG: HPr(Ser) kinase/phosphatase [Deltaproteobacteria bacterium]|nr:HPr(Ser) kinase/phosphatase [Deltaproteobacteria bacterium]
MISVSINELLGDKEYKLALELVAGEKGLPKKIVIPQIQKPGLALTGDTSNLHPGRIQILGTSELNFLTRLPAAKRRTIIKKICHVDIACFIVTHGNPIPESFVEETEKNRIPLLKTTLSTATFIMRVSRFLEDKLTAQTAIHGVLVDIFGVGILLVGKSGIGKSESALELIMKGHRLVADDIVNIRKKPPGTLYGSGSELIKYHMEIRGLGIINIKDLFGVSSVRDQKLIELVIELVEWKPSEEYERLGVTEHTYKILDAKVPFLRIPVRPGRNLTAIIEVAARNQLLKAKGVYSAYELQENLTRELLNQQKEKDLPQGIME